MAEEIPKKMKAVCIRKEVSNFETDLKDVVTIEEVDVPTPKSGQVLIKVHYSTINPSDLAFLQNRYDVPLAPGSIAGFEGSGVVVAGTGGMFDFRRIGKRVAFHTQGVWAEYVVADVNFVVDLPDSVPLEASANAIINPMTVMGMIEVTKAGGHTSLVHTGAASALGRMLIRHCKSERIEVVCVVRREEQAEICHKEGATHVVVTAKDGWEAELKEITAKLNTRLAFDCVAGEMTGKLMAAMPADTTVNLYGCLSGDPNCTVSVADVSFQGKVLKGFYLLKHIKSKNMLGMLLWARKISSLVQSELSSQISKTVLLEEVCDGILFYLNNMTAGKVLIKIAAEKPTIQPVKPVDTSDTEAPTEPAVPAAKGEPTETTAATEKTLIEPIATGPEPDTEETKE